MKNYQSHKMKNAREFRLNLALKFSFPSLKLNILFLYFLFNFLLWKIKMLLSLRVFLLLILNLKYNKNFTESKLLFKSFFYSIGKINKRSFF